MAPARRGIRADVGITGDRITAIGKLADREAKTRIDATNLVVAPGFIDMLGQSEFNVLVDPRAASKITQGITTEITGEDRRLRRSTRRWPRPSSRAYDRFKVALDFRTLGEYFARLERTPAGASISAASSAPAACATT